VDFNLEFLARLQPHAPGVGVSDQQVAIAVHPCAEFSLAAATATTATTTGTVAGQAVACGYVGPSGRLLKKSFYRALIEAKGYSLPSHSAGGGSGGGGSRGRQAEFRTRVHGNGNLLIGHAYTRRMGLEPGQEFKIEIHKETGAIWLLPMEEGASTDS